uniref:IS3 family transposase n=1 Tax=Pedobacter schmidteae TaxID=2201271 RepID=UPI000EAD3828|nr:IS3 family transposase [Pedobacter schmidteae]
MFGYTRQAYYKQMKSTKKRLLKEEVLLDIVSNYRKQMPRLGGTKLHFLINQSGCRIGRKVLYDFLKNHGLLIRRRKKYAITTNSNHWMRKWPNLIRGFDFNRSNQLWVSDITYIVVAECFAYISLITDAYSHKIIGYSLDRTLESSGSIRALQMAIKNTGIHRQPGLIHHSDRGVQYCCKEYVKMLKDNNIRISMTENGDPYENALAERVNGILKGEWIDHERYDDFDKASDRINQIINIYNTLRPHSSCDMLTPEKAQTKQGRLKKRWKKRKSRKKEIILYKPM